jgi:octaprenyl-diphosphate synthase
MTDLKQKILTAVEPDLVAIEKALADNLTPYLDLVADVARHILFSGGKRLRPLLMVLSADLCGLKGDHTHKFSTIFEYLHAATLLHDDLVDGASVRRGKATAYTVWDNATAVLVGDFLYARSLSIASETGRPEIIRVIAEITESMSQGEIHQLLRKGALDLSETEYMQVIQRKTAVLFQGACCVSAILAGVSNEKEAALSSFGLNLGLAFQMADDLLDYTVDSQTLGKRVGADLREGKLTLPVIWALKQAADDDRRQMIRIIRNENFTDEEYLKLIDMLNKHEGIAYTRKRAADHILQAKQALSIFDNAPAKEILLDIAEYALARKL